MLIQHIPYPDGGKSTVSLKDLARCPPACNNREIVLPVEATETNDSNLFIDEQFAESPVVDVLEEGRML